MGDIIAPNLTRLSEDWIYFKNREDSAYDERLKIEAQICALLVGDEGTTSGIAGGYKISVTRKNSYIVDNDAYLNVSDQIPSSLNPVRYKPALDLKLFRAVEKSNPKVFKLFIQFITIKPAKPSIKIEEVTK